MRVEKSKERKAEKKEKKGMHQSKIFYILALHLHENLVSVKKSALLTDFKPIWRHGTPKSHLTCKKMQNLQGSPRSSRVKKLIPGSLFIIFHPE